MDLKFQFFSQIQKSPKLPRGGAGGQEECGFFPLFVTFINSEASLRVMYNSDIFEKSRPPLGFKSSQIEIGNFLVGISTPSPH